MSDAAKRKKQKIKTVLAWAGVYDGEIDFWNTQPKSGAIYGTRKEARDHYAHVIRVKIVPQS